MRCSVFEGRALVEHVNPLHESGLTPTCAEEVIGDGGARHTRFVAHTAAP